MQPQTLYFAYGSNLHLTQMSHRCPQSRYLGTGTLPNYKWQINIRGYANIVPSPGDYVKGLCYLLSENDEAALDVNEGVPWAYEKVWMGVECCAGSVRVVGRRVEGGGG
ncbi:hypothetical protein HYALB_00002288 [Hymenoscyphus albidus]|uniref:gamma-glutamylcyclotransferase n=1 Tax=Hymenoscyphus albidus TaxID=595503 RepID=A0A9N9LX23_9HELO|nr:hypothetical protein HYALB_00002288 [Hymenoscyphus albidus]